MAVEFGPKNSLRKWLRAIVGKKHSDGRRPLRESDLEGITRLSEVIESLIDRTLVIDDTLRQEMVGLFRDSGILRSLSQCVHDEVAAVVVGLATDALNSGAAFQLYYEGLTGINPYSWSSTQHADAFRSFSLQILRESVTPLDDDSGSISRDPAVIKGEALAMSLRILQVVPFRSADDIMRNPTEGTTLIRFNSSTV